ncbi:MAG: hypothetical protein JWM56_1046 [Candidatus Peribacteria bacterium]|nr:hypothetical protein [Candidatus Peribacteria bacterium]
MPETYSYKNLTSLNLEAINMQCQAVFIDTYNERKQCKLKSLPV